MEKLFRQFNSIPGAVIDDSNNSVMMPLSSDQREADSSIFCMQISGEMLFYLIDIRSTEIPEAIAQGDGAPKDRILKINYCAKGRCELRLLNGECTYAEYEGLYFHLFESDEEDAGMFRYFSFCDDTPGETYHLEFRYGPTLEGLDTYFSGNYGFWLAAAIPADYDEELITNCINLFAQENLGGDE